ncbi:hypothetical protein GWI33_011119 [Rhynchophorus ferrugineus]|uniref:Uncharacterized protein n=1 Tax=Rhynchophorus ferrugineus TaxID=354439 RepID=A0A834MJB3_RHYFE|nr:hypothetical protein GWI33_011119 [Rhynchophorus ferrugineus]
MAQSTDKIFKVIVIGDSNSGKTTLTYRFCERAFIDLTETTIGVDIRTRTLEVDGENVTLEFWDTAGQERFRESMLKSYYRNAHAVVFVYDVSEPTTFHSLRKWIEESENNFLTEVPKIIIGNKCDKGIVVPRRDAQVLADSFNIPLFETSAKDDSGCDNVDGIFFTLAQKLKYNRTFLPKSNNVKVGAKMKM